MAQLGGCMERRVSRGTGDKLPCPPENHLYAAPLRTATAAFEPHSCGALGLVPAPASTEPPLGQGGPSAQLPAKAPPAKHCKRREAEGN